ncbi:hypothetical protein GGS23DRAFT_137969 [Durotheca rogersii]|uniref:uncharacterized protein n=1 Tax=Durotheca rogersii TaxID=419775 RepID=UPI00221ED0F8|nr:uncharacterized protein GGS23DRAFT_137969 [Durotheca rogersii]KAI5861533.1 hypothetical protein GGS23DRAFT_137969 [Durotheca rogersii]
MSQQQQNRPGPPYRPLTAGVGGLPTIVPDVPVSAVLIAVFLGFAAANMAIFQYNRRAGRKFLPSVFLFGFCMARVATLVLRIAWAARPTNVRLSIAANIFVNAGVLIVYVLDLLFALRVLRARRPRVGWHPALRATCALLYAAIAAALVMVITAIVLSVYSLNPHTLQVCRDIQLAAGTYILVFTTLPVFVLAAAYLLPLSGDEEAFGTGSMAAKAAIVLAVACLSMLNAGFRSGTAWARPRPSNDPAWYHGKAPFYVFNFVVEILMLSILTATRLDKRFYVPDGSKGPGDYSRHVALAGSNREPEGEEGERGEEGEEGKEGEEGARGEEGEKGEKNDKDEKGEKGGKSEEGTLNNA